MGGTTFETVGRGATVGAAFDAAYNDKWGPALAVKSGDDEWTFCGFASC